MFGPHVNTLKSAAVIASLMALAACSCEGGPCETHEPAPIDDARLEPGAYPDPLEQLARMPGSTFVEILEVRAKDPDTLFFCSGVQGMRVVDISDPQSPQVTDQLVGSQGSSRFPRCQHITFSGDVVYISSRGDEIQPVPFISVFDLAAGTTEIDFFTQAGLTFEGMAAVGDRLFAAVHGDGLAILRFTGSALVLERIVPGFVNAWAVAVDGDTAYVADGPAGIKVVDIQTAATASVIGSEGLGGQAQSIEIDPVTRHAYVAAGSAGLIVVDVSVPTTPVVVASADTPGSALQVALDNDHAYVADWNDARVFDISDPAAPRLMAVERVQTGSAFSRVLGVGAINNHMFAGEWTGLYSFRYHPGRRAPSLFVSPPQIEFGNVQPGETDPFVMVVENHGTEPLVAFDVSTDDSDFEVTTDQFLLNPGEQSILEVLFSPTSDVQQTACLNISSDDPSRPVVDVPLSGNRPGSGVGDPAPEVEVSLLSGGTWRASDQQGEVVVLAYFATF